MRLVQCNRGIFLMRTAMCYESGIAARDGLRNKGHSVWGRVWILCPSVDLNESQQLQPSAGVKARKEAEKRSGEEKRRPLDASSPRETVPPPITGSCCIRPSRYSGNWMECAPNGAILGHITPCCHRVRACCGLCRKGRMGIWICAEISSLSGA